MLVWTSILKYVLVFCALLMHVLRTRAQVHGLSLETTVVLYLAPRTIMSWLVQALVRRALRPCCVLATLMQLTLPLYATT